MLGKRAYAFEITKALDGHTIWLGNADYSADITTTNSGGTLIDTGEGIVTITFGSRNADKTYATDPTGIAGNEDSYTMHANADKMQNDRVLGNILLTKVDLDAARYLAAGSNGDNTLEGAVYDLYAADTIEHPDGVSGVVGYSKISDANGQPIWHTTVLTNGGWDTDYLPILQKDRLVASAKITDGKLAFANSCKTHSMRNCGQNCSAVLHRAGERSCLPTAPAPRPVHCNGRSPLRVRLPRNSDTG